MLEWRPWRPAGQLSARAARPAGRRRGRPAARRRRRGAAAPPLVCTALDFLILPVHRFYFLLGCTNRLILSSAALINKTLNNMLPFLQPSWLDDLLAPSQLSCANWLACTVDCLHTSATVAGTGSLETHKVGVNESITLLNMAPQACSQSAAQPTFATPSPACIDVHRGPSHWTKLFGVSERSTKSAERSTKSAERTWMPGRPCPPW